MGTGKPWFSYTSGSQLSFDLFTFCWHDLPFLVTQTAFVLFFPFFNQDW